MSLPRPQKFHCLNCDGTRFKVRQPWTKYPGQRVCQGCGQITREVTLSFKVGKEKGYD